VQLFPSQPFPLVCIYLSYFCISVPLISSLPYVHSTLFATYFYLSICTYNISIFYLYLSRNVSHLSMTRAVSAIGSILLIILAISSWHFAAKTVTQLKNLEKKIPNRKKNYTYYANVHLLMHADCPVSSYSASFQRLHILCARKKKWLTLKTIKA
jgi:hypothetical protein